MSNNTPAIVFHKAAHIFPMMDDDQLAALAADIRKSGQRLPIILDQTGLGIDGRNRLAACKIAGIPPIIEKRTFESEIDRISFIGSVNGPRRHLTSSQRAMFGESIAAMIEELEIEAKKRQEASRAKPGEKVGGHKAVVLNTTTLGAPKEAIPPDPAPAKTRDKIASMVGVSPSYIQSAKLVKKEAPDLAKEVQEGKLTIPAAVKEVKARAEALENAPPEKQEAFATIIRGGGPKEIKAALVELVGKEAVSESAKIIRKENPHVSNNSGENEWYTPPHIIEPARACMGGIDLDPASSDLANKTVKAEKYYTAESSGLKQPWHGMVWLNPPYSADLIGLFIEAVASKFENREYKKAIVLVNNATDTAWFHRLMQVATAVCFLKGRIRFIDKDGRLGGTPLQGQMLVFLGCEQPDIIDHFGSLGTILWL